MVILYENNPEEVWELDKRNLQKRLYKVTGMSSMVLQDKYYFGTIELVHHQDARPSTEIKRKMENLKPMKSLGMVSSYSILNLMLLFKGLTLKLMI